MHKQTKKNEKRGQNYAKRLDLKSLHFFKLLKYFTSKTL